MVIVSQRFHLNFELIAIRFVLGRILTKSSGNLELQC